MTGDHKPSGDQPENPRALSSHANEGDIKLPTANSEDSGQIPALQPTDENTWCRYLHLCDSYIMSTIFLAWCLFYLDRGTISLAYINGMGSELRLDGKKLNVAIMIFFATYIAVNIPANLVLRRVGARYWLSGLIFTWGVCTTMSGFVKTYPDLLITRIFLGLCEGGFLGGALLYLGFFYTREELMVRVGIFFSSTPLAAAVAGLLGLGLGSIEFNGYNGWPWIFFVEGAVTCFLGVVAFFVLPDTPRSARFLSNEEKNLAQARFDLDNGKINENTSQYENEHSSQPEEDRLKKGTLLRAIGHPLTLMMALSAFLTVSVVYAWNLFMPPIVAALVTKGAGSSAIMSEEERLKANGLTVPPNILGVIATITVVWFAQKFKSIGVAFSIMGCSFIGMIGYALLLAGGQLSQRWVQYAGTFFVAASVYPLMPLGLYWITVNAKPHFERAIAIGFVIMIGNFGAFVASFTYIPTEYP